MAYTLEDFTKLNPRYKRNWDATKNQATLTDTQTGKKISFGKGQGEQYGIGGIQNGSHMITDINKLRGAFGDVPTQQYKSPYSDQILSTLSMIQNRQPFKYDAANDQGLQAAQESAINATSRAAARRGMLYSNSNKSQMGKSALQLVPQFQSIAQQQYQQQGQDLYNQLSALLGLENQSYGQYRDTVGDQRYQNDMMYNRGRDSIMDQRYLDQNALEQQKYTNETAYNRNRDTIGDQRYINQLNYQRGRDAVSDARYNQEFQYRQQQDLLDNLYRQQQGQNQPYTPEEYNYYNAFYEQLSQNPMQSIQTLVQNKPYYTKYMGEELYNQLVNDIQTVGEVMNPAQQEMGVNDYKTNPNFADDVSFIEQNPDQAMETIKNNAQALIAAYGYEGYSELKKLAENAGFSSIINNIQSD